MKRSIRPSIVPPREVTIFSKPGDIFRTASRTWVPMNLAVNDRKFLFVLAEESRLPNSQSALLLTKRRISRPRADVNILDIPLRSES